MVKGIVKPLISKPLPLLYLPNPELYLPPPSPSHPYYPLPNSYCLFPSPCIS